MNRLRWSKVSDAEERALVFNYQKTKEERYINELLSQYRKILLRFTNETTGWQDPEHAEDLVQECLIRIYKHIDVFDIEMKFCTWAHVIMVNLIKNSWKSAKRHKMVSLYSYDKGRSHMEMRSNDQMQDDELHSKMILHAVVSVIPRLNKIQRDIFIMYFLKDYSYNDIAQKVGIPVGTVKSKIHHARMTVFNLVGGKILDEFVVTRRGNRRKIKK